MASCLKQIIPLSTASRPSLIHLPLPPLLRSNLSSPPSSSSSRLSLLSPSTRRTFSMSDSIKRNPHPDFKSVEASRPDWDASSNLRFTKAPAPEWKFGDGANAVHAEPDKVTDKYVTINPYEEGRSAGSNYKLLISGVVPRPIAFVSTRSTDGKSVNLAPFSWFNMMSHDPPLFVIGFAAAGPGGAAKDSLRNLKETGQCVINIISESFVEAANAASVNAPYGSSEWAVSGLTPVYDCQTVDCARVGEAVFSVEAKLDSLKEFESRAKPGQLGTTMAIVEGTRFWVREDAINEEKNLIDPAVLRPISRLGGITYGRITEAIEIPRADFDKDVGGEEGFKKLETPSST